MVSRARDMYSASLTKEDFLAMKKLVKVRSRRVANALDGCNRALLELKRNCDELEKFDFLETESLVLKLMRLSTIMEEFFQEQEHPHPSFPTTPLPPSDKEQLLNFYFEIRSFQNIYELVDEHYIIYGDYTSDGHFVFTFTMYGSICEFGSLFKEKSLQCLFFCYVSTDPLLSRTVSRTRR